MREEIFLKYKRLVDSNRDRKLLPILAEMVADAILFEGKKSVSYGLNGEWNSCGPWVPSPDGLNFDRTKYRKLEDFLDELTGDSAPTFISGAAHYTTYYDKVEEIFEEFLSENRAQIFSVISEEESKFLLDICKKNNIEDVDQYDIADVFEELDFFDHEVDLKIANLEWTKNLDFAWLLKIGEPLAKKAKSEDKRKRPYTRRIEKQKSGES